MDSINRAQRAPGGDSSSIPHRSGQKRADWSAPAPRLPRWQERPRAPRELAGRGRLGGLRLATSFFSIRASPRAPRCAPTAQCAPMSIDVLDRVAMAA